MTTAEANQAANAMFPIDQVKNVHVVFRDGMEIDGFVQNWKGNDPVANVRLCQHSVLRDQDPHVTLDFAQIARVEIEYLNGRTASFPS